jgi:hypothetical protein
MVAGCESTELQDLVVGWMDEMTRHTKAVAPRQLAALGTEVGVGMSAHCKAAKLNVLQDSRASFANLSETEQHGWSTLCIGTMPSVASGL